MENKCMLRFGRGKGPPSAVLLFQACIVCGRQASPAQWRIPCGTPSGSCLVLKGYGGDSAMHCVPPVAARRISITLRRQAKGVQSHARCTE